MYFTPIHEKTTCTVKGLVDDQVLVTTMSRILYKLPNPVEFDVCKASNV